MEKTEKSAKKRTKLEKLVENLPEIDENTPFLSKNDPEYDPYLSLPEMINLKPRYQSFVLEYITHMNGGKAAIACGYSKHKASSIASDLLNNREEVKAAKDACLALKNKKRAVTIDYVLDVITSTVERCRQAEKVLDKEGSPTGEYKFDAPAVLRGCELLGKHLAMFTDKVAGTMDTNVTGSITITPDLIKSVNDAIEQSC